MNDLNDALGLVGAIAIGFVAVKWVQDLLAREQARRAEKQQ